MYSWRDGADDWQGAKAYEFSPAARERRQREARRAEARGPRTYQRKRSPDSKRVDPSKHLVSQSTNPLIIAVDVTGSMARWPFEIFDRLPLLFNTLSQYRQDLEICFAAIGDAYVDQWPLQTTSFASGFDLEDELAALHGEGGGGDFPESYGLFAWWVDRHVSVPNAEKPFLIVFGDATMHQTVTPGEVRALLGDEIDQSADSLRAWKRVTAKWNTWFLRRKGRKPDDEVQRQWSKAIGKQRIFEIDDEARAVDYAMGLIARSWGHFGDFTDNLEARQSGRKTKSVAAKIRQYGPKVVACPQCSAPLPSGAKGALTCTHCGASLVL